MAALGEGRFLGWLEWLPTGPDEDDASRPAAIWSDAGCLGESDGFDLAKWRRELKDLAVDAGASGRGQRPLRKRQLDKETWLPLLPAQASRSPPEATRRRSSKHAAYKVGVLPAIGKQLRGTVPKVATTTGVDMSFAALSDHASQYDNIFRGTIPNKFRRRGARLLESARLLRSCADTTGHEHRRRAAEWRERARQKHTQLESFEEKTLNPEELEKNAVRSMRLNCALARIRSRAVSMDSECRSSLHAELLPESLFSRQVSLAEEGEEEEEEVSSSDFDEEDSPRAESPKGMRQKLFGCVMARLEQKKRQENRVRKLRKKKQLKDIPDTERQAILAACSHYQANGRISLGHLVKALAELGLRGVTSGEKFAVDNMVRHCSAALVVRDADRQGIPEDAPLYGQAASRQVSKRRLTIDLPSPGGTSPLSFSPTTASLPSVPQSPIEAAGLLPATPATRQASRRASRVAHGKRARRQSSQVFVQEEAEKLINVEDFCNVIVPAAHEELHNERADVHFEQFLDTLTDENSLTISLEQFRELAARRGFDKECLEAALQDLGNPQRDRPSSTPSDPHDTGSISGAAGSPRAGAASRRRQQRGRRTSQFLAAPPQLQLQPDVELDFQSVHDTLTRLEVETERSQRKREWKIKEATDLGDQVFWEFRRELPRLHTLFLLYDIDHSGFLSPEEVRFLLKHIGLQPYAPEMSSVVDHAFQECNRDGKNDLDFAKFVAMMDVVRNHQCKERARVLRQVFDNFDKDRDGQLQPEDVVDALAVAGIVKTPADKLVVPRITETMDTGGSGLINFEDFQALAQRMVEREYSALHEKNLELGRELGFDVEQMASYQWAFDHLDVDESGTLCMEEIEMALRVFMIRPPTELELREVFTKIDKDFDGDIAFSEFLQLMKLVSEAKGIFSTEKPFTLADVPVEKQRDILRFFPIAESYIRNLELGELLETVGNFMGFQTDANLREIEKPIKNVRQLMEYARKSAKGL